MRVLAVVVATQLAGCSLLAVRGPSASREYGAAPACSTSGGAVAGDVVLGLTGLIILAAAGEDGAAIGLVTGGVGFGSMAYGVSRNRRCSNARIVYQQELEEIALDARRFRALQAADEAERAKPPRPEPVVTPARPARPVVTPPARPVPAPSTAPRLAEIDAADAADEADDVDGEARGDGGEAGASSEAFGGHGHALAPEPAGDREPEAADRGDDDDLPGSSESWRRLP